MTYGTIQARLGDFLRCALFLDAQATLKDLQPSLHETWLIHTRIIQIVLGTLPIQKENKR